MLLYPLEDIEVWLDEMAFDDNNTPLWRVHGGISLDDAMILTLDIAYVMGRCTSG